MIGSIKASRVASSIEAHVIKVRHDTAIIKCPKVYMIVKIKL